MGETVKVTGSGPELGDWNPANALTLYTNDKEYPIWRAGIFIDQERQWDENSIEYKYIITAARSDSEDKNSIPPAPYWENFEGNRTITLRQSGEVQVQDVFNELKLIKLEVHTEETQHSFQGLSAGKSSRR